MDGKRGNLLKICCILQHIIPDPYFGVYKRNEFYFLNCPKSVCVCANSAIQLMQSHQGKVKSSLKVTLWSDDRTYLILSFFSDLSVGVGEGNESASTPSLSSLKFSWRASQQKDDKSGPEPGLRKRWTLRRNLTIKIFILSKRKYTI